MIVNSDALTVACPTCHAEPAQPCHGGNRTYRGGRVHAARNTAWHTTSGGQGTNPDQTRTLEPDPDRPGAYRNP